MPKNPYHLAVSFPCLNHTERQRNPGMSYSNFCVPTAPGCPRATMSRLRNQARPTSPVTVEVHMMSIPRCMFFQVITPTHINWSIINILIEFGNYCMQNSEKNTCRSVNSTKNTVSHQPLVIKGSQRMLLHCAEEPGRKASSQHGKPHGASFHKLRCRCDPTHGITILGWWENSGCPHFYGA